MHLAKTIETGTSLLKDQEAAEISVVCTGGGNVWCDIAKYIVKWTQEKWACDWHDDATALSL